MLAFVPQAPRLTGGLCAPAATGDERIDSAHGTFRLEQTISTREQGDCALLSLAKSREAKLVAALAAAGLALTPAFAASSRQEAPPAVSLSFDSLSSFTPANADPKLAAALAGKSPVADRFQVHSGPAKGRPSQVRVAIRARVNAPGADRGCPGGRAGAAVAALTPTSYNLGVAVGWRQFAVVRRRIQGQGGRSGDRRPRDCGGRRQLFAQEVHRPSRGRGRQARRQAASGAASRRYLSRSTSAVLTRCRAASR